jgi:hypothetical protein
MSEISQAEIDRATIALHRRIERAILGGNHNAPARLVDDLLWAKLQEIRPSKLTDEVFRDLSDYCELIVKRAGLNFSPMPE